MTVSKTVGAALLGGTKDFSDQEWETLPVGKYTAAIEWTSDRTSVTIPSANVIAYIPSKEKSDEYLFITSHYDHEGIKNGVIYYGADDDGSGTTGVVAIAEAFAYARKKGFSPKRNIVFMNVSGEEKGLLGSKYYGDHPIFPLEKTTADLNIDMIGRIDPTYKGDSMNYVYVIGEDKLSSDLQPITDKVNKNYNMELDRRFNDPKDPNRFYYRSDHYNFAAKGVPVIFYFNGTHADYHKPTDRVEKINFDLMEKRTRVIFETAWEMATREEMLKRDMPLNMPATR
jgi:Zn-dependent M28 family amino/carboxypeptidase